MIDLIGIWIAALLTIFVFSFLFKDNPCYRFAEHLFIGVSAGYYVAFYSWKILWPKLFLPLFAGNLVLLLVLILGLMTFGKVTRNYKWTSRWPIAFVVGCTVGLAIVSKLQANVVEQCRATVQPFEGKAATAYSAMHQYAHGVKDSDQADKGLSLTQMENFYRDAVKPALPKDRNGDGRVSLAEWQKFTGIPGSLFFKIDKDRDSFVTPRELDQFRQRYPQEYPQNFDRSQWDFNDDGRFSLVECEPYPGLPTRVYQFLDPDNKGLTKGQLDMFTKKVRGHFPLDPKFFFTKADRNSNGIVDAQEWHAPPFWNAKVINGIICLIGIVCGLVYFFFSAEHRGFTGGVSRLGVYFLMVCFGASFGYTVMARISLLIGRMIFLMKDWLHLPVG